MIPPRGGDGPSSDSDSTDDDDPYAPVAQIPKDEVQAAFEEIINDVGSGKRKVRQKPERKEFVTKYGDILVKKTQQEKQTLLHVIANRLDHRALARCVLKRNKRLLEDRDDSGKTPLHYAILKRNIGFLEVVLKEIHASTSNPDNENPEIRDVSLDKILAMEIEHGRNCIHLTISESGDLKMNREEEYAALTIQLIQRASKETLSANDENGLTPLHLAVEYSRSSEAQLGIVQALITHGDGALDKLTTKPKGLSVYQYHQSTRGQVIKKSIQPPRIRGAEKSLKEAPSTTAPALKNGTTKARHGESGGATKSDRREQGRVSAGTAQTYSKPTLVITSNTMFSHPTTDTASEGQSPVKKSRLADFAGFEPSGPQRRTTGLEGPKEDENIRQSIENERRRVGYADKIRKELKLRYLRSTFLSPTDDEDNQRDQFRATRFLHGANIENIHLCFDFSEAPEVILEESFRQSFDHMSFDDTLRYVSFGRIELQNPVKIAPDSKFSKHFKKPKVGLGRSDLTFFFKWLYEKHVRHILKVTVDDLKDPPHTDKAIEESLGLFEVETLDWQKLDLCPETLHTACPEVRELHLRWSGNRAVLRAWGEPDGLPKLKNLEKVHIIWDSGKTSESPDRIGVYIKNFKQRLEQSLKKINDENTETAQREIIVHTDKGHGRSSDPLAQTGGSMKKVASTNERNQVSHQWLECMDTFGEVYSRIKVPEKYTGELERDIKVALIDDGADPYVESLRGKIKGGLSFDRGYPHENGPSPYHVSSRGHGTVMADMICRVCPMAKLYVYKLETHYSVSQETQTETLDQISADSATLAIKAAVDQKVDIISISWTVKEVEDDQKSISQLREAVKLALDAGILMFCAAADTGAVIEDEYPWSYDQKRIFRIGAATADGTIWDPTGSREKVNFILPGHNVVSRNPHHEGALPPTFKERTGSSISTALASGLAALILHCVMLGAIHSEMEIQLQQPSLTGISSTMAIKPEYFLKMNKYRFMNGVFRGIGVDEGQQKFIEVWKMFDEPARELKIRGMEERGWEMEGMSSELAVIAKLARDFVSFGGK